MSKWIICVCVSLASMASAQEAVDMKLHPSDAMKEFHGYMPQSIMLSDQQPASITKLPSGLKSPKFGTMAFHIASGTTSVAVVMDSRTGQPAALYIDANGNGDLTDDPAVKWNEKSKTLYMTDVSLPIGQKDHSSDVKVVLYHFHDDPTRAKLENNIFFYGDYGVFGTITLAGKSYKAGLNDVFCSGDFRGSRDAKKTDSGIVLMIDTNGSGKLSRLPGASFDAAKPFNIAGATYELHDMTADGQFGIIKSAQSVAEIPPPPNLEVGQPVPAFTALTMDGKTVHFPADYKGHVVMLDFWATWCGPCMGEVPGLAKTYEGFHPKGFDVLGVSLDDAKDEKHVGDVLKENKMVWPEVYDGKGWEAAIAKQYGVRSIPAPILVDGDTGKILATEAGLRGEALEPTIQKALAKRNSPAIQ